MPQEQSPDNLDFTRPPSPSVDPLSGKSIEELKAKRAELAERLAGKKEGEDWKAELEMDLVQKAIQSIDSKGKEGTPDELDLTAFDTNVSARARKGDTLH